MDDKKWRTNTGIIAGSIGGALLTAAELMDSVPMYKLIFQIAGTILGTFGASMAAYGLGVKIERNNAECTEVKTPIGEQGFTRLNLVAVLWLGMALVFSGCIGQTPAEKSICSTQAEASGSVICRIATERGWTVEDIDTMLLDATITAWAFDIVEKQEILDALDQVEKYVVTNQDVVLKTIVDMLITDSKKSEALKSVLSRRIKFLDVPEVATSYDLYLILTEVKHQREQFGG